MQPWNFITIRDAAKREAICQIFNKANEEAPEIFSASEERLIVRSNWKAFARHRSICA
jgi:5,6-dimethylbenzimidazole synthase